MSHPRPASLARSTLFAGLLGLALTAAHAQRSLTIVVGTCPPSTAAALHGDLKLTNGSVVKPGRNPPSMYFCGVPAGDFAAAPTWNTLELQFRDRNKQGIGNVRARLMRKSLGKGSAREVAVVESVPSIGVQTVSTALPGALDFTRFAYYFIVELETPQKPVEAHLVRLTTR
jgi:hypothetical protein